mmetsp:Transcript_28595/g.48340  ORF Transcript_28595/g.48340 Transcript_28595/m.48340 type:complete len:86 (+) Transcript_28595:116-373(+)
MDHSPQQPLHNTTESMPNEPFWATIKTSGDYLVATFPQCLCTRGRPPKFVRQEKVRFDMQGADRTSNEAGVLLLVKLLWVVETIN